MRLPRVYLPGGIDRLEAEQVHYLLRVLRLKRGSCFVGFDGDGSESVLEIVNTGPALELARREVRRPKVEAAVRLTLYLGLTKGERFENALERATELGVCRLIPLECARSAVKSPGASRQKRWQSIVVSAACQSGRVVVPQVDPPCSFTEALEQVEGSTSAVLFAPGSPPLRSALGAAGSLLVGPEGGFAPEEMEAAVRVGVRLAGLGPRTLRVETATAAALTLVYRLAGEL